jgi:hypothetical protein
MNTTGTALLGFAVIIGVLMACFRAIRYLGIASVVVGVGGITFYLWQGRHWVNGYDSAHLGFTETQVVKLLGRPTRITDGTEWVEPGE